MNKAAAYRKFMHQKSKARSRGIGWELTFWQWLDWWGEDLDRRGVSTSSLQMQRVADTGPYALGNIRKGTPLENGKTRGRMRRKRNCDAAAVQRALAPRPSFRDYTAPDTMSEDEQWLYENVGWGARKTTVFDFA